ncbi:MAG: Unknown protein [uncultured Aureispira sp.]|uniref:DUF4271 domain-containing protein n=1 Tax=uncultured Aureispira sp. TaxID=1331704 RepID=A0A6S6T9H7_9BACT|nr:MAG: Unknown protein [uncultured Aureispira sp.]
MLPKCSLPNLLPFFRQESLKKQTSNAPFGGLYCLKMCLVFVFFISGNTILSAQKTPSNTKQDSTQKAVQSIPKRSIISIPRSIRKKTTWVETDDFDLAKTNTISYFSKAFKVKKDALSRKYYNNNLFDIAESDNPFALPIGDHKSKQKIKTTTKTENQLVFSELFALNGNDDEQGIAKWLIFVLLGLLSLMSIIVAIYKKEVSSIFQAFISTSSSQNGQREQASVLTINRFSSYILFVLSMGTFCFLIPQILLQEFQLNTFGALCLFILGLGAIYFLKHVQLKILSYILPFPQEIEAYSFIISNTNKALGFIIVPLLFLIAYTPATGQIMSLYFSFILLSLIYIYRILKGLATAGSIILFHKFHFFVYLCAVEIAPIVILLKILSIL